MPRRQPPQRGRQVVPQTLALLGQMAIVQGEADIILDDAEALPGPVARGVDDPQDLRSSASVLPLDLGNFSIVPSDGDGPGRRSATAASMPPRASIIAARHSGWANKPDNRAGPEIRCNRHDRAKRPHGPPCAGGRGKLVFHAFSVPYHRGTGNCSALRPPASPRRRRVALIRPVLKVTIPWLEGGEPPKVGQEGAGAVRRMPWAVYLWPGLPQLAGRGSWAALAVAIGAAALLCVALLGTFVWTELLTANLRILYWLLLLAPVEWFRGTVWRGSDHRRSDCRPEPEGSKDLFRQSLDHYLQGNWFEAQRDAGPVVARESPRRGSPLDAGDLAAAHGAARGSGPAVGRPGRPGRGPEVGLGNPAREGVVGGRPQPERREDGTRAGEARENRNHHLAPSG